MKVAPFFGFVVVLCALSAAQGRPTAHSEKGTREASIYVLGALNNAAVSHNYSKSQAASDRNESEWNNTEMLNSVHKDPIEEDELARQMRGGGVLIYSGGDAANLAVAYQGSESQAAENDQKSGYNSQNLGMGVDELDEEEMEDERK